jgi:aminopeptidase
VKTLFFAIPLLAATLGVALADDKTNPATTSPDALAKQLVNKVAQVKEGDIVQISGQSRDEELLESLSVECAKLGADTVVTLNPTDKTTRRLFTDVPEKFDKRMPQMAMKMAETVTVMFSVERSDSLASEGLPPERIQARAAAAQSIQDKLLARNVRQVYIGNGLYPSEARAKELGLSKDELTAMFRAGLAVDYDALCKSADKVKAALGGKQVKLVSPNGTDFTMGIEKQPVLASDGVITDEKTKAGGAACMVWLPAGEVYVRPMPNTATGKVVVPRSLYEGMEIADLTLTIAKGKLTEMTAKPGPGFDRLQAMYKAAPAGKDQVGVVDVGVNSAVKFPAKAKDVSFMAAGTVTIFIGGDAWAGGDNKCPFGISAFIRDGTLTVDGKELVKDGDLQLK